jgi:cobalt/nickel transport system permease protein
MQAAPLACKRTGAEPMANVERASAELRQMDDLANSVSSIHSLHPPAKLIVTISYVLATVSFDRYELTALSGMILYPAALFALSGIPVRTCLHKLRFVLPLVLAVGLFNPLLDRTPLFRLGTVTVTGGVVSMLSLMCKGAFCLAASFLLAATTPIDALCAALRRVRVPSFLVTLLLLTYRYVSVMLDEVSVMTTAYRLRAPGQKGIHVSAWGSFLGQLLLRSMDRAQELYASMLLRGYHQHFHYAPQKPFGKRDAAFLGGSLLLFALFRFVGVAHLLGGLFVR